MVDLPPDKT